MRSFKVTLSYDGTNYSGWQVQPNGVTIQEKLEGALARVCGVRIRVTASGRTDAGVHALGQVASFSADTTLSASQLHRALNGSLPPDIRILGIEDAPVGFHAIREARSKRYRYQFWDASQHDVFQRLTNWHVRLRLDERAMQLGAEYLIGCHDFASFQAAGSPRATTSRTVSHLSVNRNSHLSDQVVMTIEADGYLYNMVRNIAGSLAEVGKGVHEPSWIQSVLQARDRRCAGPTAPAQGLFLVSVGF
jgi:tRNA pseudouridine38-40 synthase